MKKIILLPVVSFMLTMSATAQEGCAGVCISLVPYVSNSSVPADTVYLNSQNGITLYANYSSCCHDIFGDSLKLIWALNGNPYDTTIAYTTSNYVYTHQITTTTPGTYTVYFWGFFYPNNPYYTCRHITVLSDSGPSGITVSSTENSPVKIFPNPVKKEITVSSSFAEKGKVIVTVYNAAGVEIRAEEELAEAGPYTKTIAADEWPGRIYFIKIDSPAGTQTSRLIKE